MIFRPPSTSNNTPSIICLDSERSIRTNGGSQPLTDRRPDIHSEMELEFFSCPYDDFMSKYSPFKPPDAEVEACVEHLLKICAKGDPETLLKKIKIDGQDYLRITKLHNIQYPIEAATFSHFDGIAQGITTYKPGGRRSTFSCFDCPKTALQADIGGSNHEIDGAFIFRDVSTKPLDTSNIAVCAEFKLKNTSEKRLDVSRRCIFNVFV